MTDEPGRPADGGRARGSKWLALAGAYAVLLLALLGVLALAGTDSSSLRLTLIAIGFAFVAVLVTARTLRGR